MGAVRRGPGAVSVLQGRAHGSRRVPVLRAPAAPVGGVSRPPLLQRLGRSRQDALPHLRVVLPAVRRAVHEMQVHTVRSTPGQRRVQGARSQFVAADYADRREAQQPARGRRRPQMVGVRAAERQQRPAGRRMQVRDEFAPLVARDVRVDQVVALEQQTDAVTREALVLDRLQRRRQSRPQRGGEVERFPGHLPIVTSRRLSITSASRVTAGVRGCGRASSSS